MLPDVLYVYVKGRSETSEEVHQNLDEEKGGISRPSMGRNAVRIFPSCGSAEPPRKMKVRRMAESSSGPERF
jgi:hypothetical protein